MQKEIYSLLRILSQNFLIENQSKIKFRNRINKEIYPVISVELFKLF